MKIAYEICNFVASIVFVAFLFVACIALGA